MFSHTYSFQSTVFVVLHSTRVLNVLAFYILYPQQSQSLRAATSFPPLKGRHANAGWTLLWCWLHDVIGKFNILGIFCGDPKSSRLIFIRPYQRICIAVGVIGPSEFSIHCYILCRLCLIVTTKGWVIFYRGCVYWTTHSDIPFGVVCRLLG